MPSIGLHNTSLKKAFSELFETNALKPIIPVLNTEIQPTKEIQYKLINKSRFTTGTIYITPVDKEFYLKSVMISGAAYDTDSAGNLQFTYYDEDNIVQYILLHTGGGHYADLHEFLVFPERGILIRKGTAIAINVSGITGGASAHITGYLASDRS